MTFSNFFDSLGDLDWLAIIVGTIAVFVFAWIWYGPVLGKAWLAATGRQQTDPDPATYAKGFVAFLLFNVGVAYFIPATHFMFQNAATFETLIVSSLVLSFFIMGMVMATRAVWEDGQWTLWAINTGFFFLATVIAAEVQDLMA